MSEQLPKVERLPGTVAVVSGGAADQPVADECRIVAEHLGCFAFKMVGAGLQDRPNFSIN
jgi:NCAIR mutase (PurE)-related protein